MINSLLDNYISVNYKIIKPIKPEFDTVSGGYFHLPDKYLFILDMDENRLYPEELLKELDTIFYVGDEIIKKHIEKWVKTLKVEFDLEQYWALKLPSYLSGGSYNTVSGTYSVAFGTNNTVSGYRSVIGGGIGPATVSSRYS